MPLLGQRNRHSHLPSSDLPTTTNSGALKASLLLMQLIMYFQVREHRGSLILCFLCLQAQNTGRLWALVKELSRPMYIIIILIIMSNTPYTLNIQGPKCKNQKI